MIAMNDWKGVRQVKIGAFGVAEIILSALAKKLLNTVGGVFEALEEKGEGILEWNQWQSPNCSIHEWHQLLLSFHTVPLDFGVTPPALTVFKVFVYVTSPIRILPGLASTST
jgi:hypothetical protein